MRNKFSDPQLFFQLDDTEMAYGKKARNEARSSTCSNSSSCQKESGEADQSCSEESSRAVSSSDKHASDSVSGKEECLAKEACLKKSQPKSSSCSNSSGEMSSEGSESSVCKSIKCCLKSKCGNSESISGSEDTESNATESSIDAEISIKDKKAVNSKKENNDHISSKEDTKAEENKENRFAWSLSEDALLRSMKEANDGLSWEDIGKSLSRGKNECKSRWKAIKDQPVHDIISEGEAKENAEPGEQAPTEAKTANRDNDSKIRASADEHGTADGVSRPSRQDLIEHECQKQYWHEHIARHLYPASIRVEPDAHFSQSDCRVLEMIDARYQSVRWLETQARFYNETGRMVPLEAIRRKCEDATVRTETDIASWLDSIPY